MDGALGWLSSLMESVGHLFPRLLHVQSNELAVIFRRGKCYAKRPGIYLYWPVWSKPEKEVAVRQTFTLETQTLTTIDGKTVSARAQIVITVFDALLAFGETASWNEIIRDVATCGVKSVVCKTALHDLLTQTRAVDIAITRRIRSELRPFGIHVVRAFLSDFSPTRAITLIRE